jgi:hypothetical protein
VSDAPNLVGLDRARDDAGFRFELLDVDERPLGWLTGVEGGTLDFNANSRVKAGGSIEVKDVDGVDWTIARVRPWAHVDDIEWPLGVFLAAAPQDAWSGGRWGGSVELLGKLATLDTDYVPAAVAYPAGTVVTEAVREQIGLAGQTGYAVTASPQTLATAMVWDAGTSRLTIINELLAAIGYWSLTADGMGRFIAAPYTRPSDRPVRYPLLDSPSSIYADEFGRDRDFYKVPNRYVVISQGSGDTEALVGVAENTNPDSPFSIPTRGYVKAEVETGVDATDQAAIDAIAQQRLIDAMSVTTALTIQHAVIPLDPNDVVRLRRVPAGVDGRYTAQTITIPLNGLELATTTIREVPTL